MMRGEGSRHGMAWTAPGKSAGVLFASCHAGETGVLLIIRCVGLGG